MQKLNLRDWDEPEPHLRRGVREFAVQLGLVDGLGVVARSITRTPTWVSEIDRRGTGGRLLTVHDLTALTTDVFDALSREATILGGVQLSL